LNSLETWQFGSDCPLPASVTNLAAYHQFDLKFVSYGVLNPNLSGLELWFAVFSKKIPIHLSSSPNPIEGLPSSLERLRLIHLDYPIQANHWNSLPTQLQRLEIDLQNMDATLPSVFPPELTSLQLSPIEKLEHFLHFPPTLTQLHISHLKNSFSTFSDFFAMLPPSLRHLEIQNGMSSCVSTALQMPSALLTLKLPNILFDSLSALQSIPATVTTLLLNIGPNLDPNSEAIANTLRFPALRSFFGMPHICSVALLQCLTHSPHLSYVFPNSLAPYSSQYASFYLPSRTDYTRASELTFTASPSPLRFSNTLLSFMCINGGFGDSLIAALPTSLTSLQLPRSNWITDASIHDSIKHMHSLTSLVIFSNCVTGNSFKSLPRKLTLLAIPSLQEVCDEQMGDLPRTLTALHLYCATELTDDCGPFLPKTLRCFRSELNTNISKKLLPYIVKSRTSFLETKSVRVNPHNHRK
jgi:hypothetical protein